MRTHGNIPVGELIHKQGANECIDRKAKEVYVQRLRHAWRWICVIFPCSFRLCLASPQASFPKHSCCSMLRCPVSRTHQSGNLYRSKEQMNVKIGSRRRRLVGKRFSTCRVYYNEVENRSCCGGGCRYLEGSFREPGLLQ